MDIMQAPSIDEKTNLQRLYANEGGELSLQSEDNLDMPHLKPRRFRKRFHFMVLSLLVFYIIRKWSSVRVWTGIPVNPGGGWIGAKPFDWTAVR